VAAGDAGIAVRRVAAASLAELADDPGGVVARVRPRDGSREVGEAELAAYPFDDEAIVVVLDGIEDPQNLGAAARSAEAAGVAMLVNRTRRAAEATPAAIRASAGALEHLPQARVANIPRAIGRLQDAGFFVVGLDDAAPATIYDEPCPRGKIAVVVGSEGSGMSRLARERCDALVSLPVRGKVASLNAAASLAACLYAYVLPTHR
jgi:23S rRNA (guanosine2251-2'-O)-methyltransferase